jgi:hypothetical protein
MGDGLKWLEGGIRPGVDGAAFLQGSRWTMAVYKMAGARLPTPECIAASVIRALEGPRPR